MTHLPAALPPDAFVGSARLRVLVVRLFNQAIPAGSKPVVCDDGTSKRTVVVTQEEFDLVIRSLNRHTDGIELPPSDEWAIIRLHHAKFGYV